MGSVESGDRIGRYTVLGKLASGGMGDVWLARQSGPAGFEKTLVLKTIGDQVISDRGFVQMLISEARLAALLNHPNIVQIFELGEEEGQYFIAMEYLEGRNVSQLMKTLRTQGQLCPLPIAARIVAECCAGLDYAHDLKDARGDNMSLVHRDISPENIFITYSGQVKLVD